MVEKESYMRAFDRCVAEVVVEKITLTEDWLITRVTDSSRSSATLTGLDARHALSGFIKETFYAREQSQYAWRDLLIDILAGWVSECPECEGVFTQA